MVLQLVRNLAVIYPPPHTHINVHGVWERRSVVVSLTALLLPLVSTPALRPNNPNKLSKSALSSRVKRPDTQAESSDPNTKAANA
jgi:hypothetical protein